METTVFLAQIWGPVLLAIGLGVLISRHRYTRMYREVGKETFALLFFALLAIAGGIAQILAHNVWGSFPEILISLFGWILLVKGAVLAVFPKLAGKVGRCCLKSSVAIIAAGVITLILGVYITRFGFLM
ncbi:MAG: hypothetical protein WD552_03035 [Candidatus Paceibacterota bacterium]